MDNREIQAENLVKRYSGDILAVDGVSLHVRSGEIYGLLGPNGAGKSTTVGMLTTLQRPTSGKAWVGGFEVTSQAASVRRVAGVALQEIGLDPLMKATELLEIQSRLFGASVAQTRTRIVDLLDLVGLSNVADRRIGQYSGGMRRRLDLALALAHEPAILFLDEPTTGLDPASRRDIWTEVSRLNRDHGMTILLTTQYLEEADLLADRVAIIDHGQIAVEGTPAALKSRMGGESINLTFNDQSEAALALTALDGMFTSAQSDRAILRLYLTEAASAVAAVVGRLHQQGIELRSLTLSQPTLDDVFLKVTGERFEEAGEKTLEPQPMRQRSV